MMIQTPIPNPHVEAQQTPAALAASLAACSIKLLTLLTQNLQPLQQQWSVPQQNSAALV
jgi:hypothetical protein